MQLHEWAPIALFIYRRAEHARHAVESLRSCEGFDRSRLYVFADGPASSADLDAVKETRATVRDLVGDEVTFVERATNRGLAESIIAGVTELCDRHGSAVVVEDDLVLNASFLRFMNEGLQRYRDEPEVMQVSGYLPDVPELDGTSEALLLPLTSSWGWATWRRAWGRFDPDASGWQDLLGDDQAVRRFNLDGRYDFARMLERQMNGDLDSWAIRWYYSVHIHHGLVLYPPRTLVRNDGFDGSGTHGRLARRQPGQTALDPAVAWTLPDTAAPSSTADAFFRAVARAGRPNIVTSLKALRPRSVWRRMERS